jgi:hypothetical protein
VVTRHAVRAVVVALPALAAACSFPTKVLVSNDFSCLNSGDPTSAPAVVTIAGATDDEVVQHSVPDVSITLFLNDVPTPKATTASDGNGNFELMDDTTGTPRSGYLLATATNYLDTYVFPGTPFDVTPFPPLLIAMFDQTDLATIGQATMKTINNSDVQGVVIVTDCMQNPVANAVVTLDPPPEAIIYANNDMPMPGETSTDSTGLAFIINLPPGSPTVGATVDGVPLSSHTVMVNAGTILVAFVQP